MILHRGGWPFPNSHTRPYTPLCVARILLHALGCGVGRGGAGKGALRSKPLFLAALGSLSILGAHTVTNYQKKIQHQSQRPAQ